MSRKKTKRERYVRKWLGPMHWRRRRTRMKQAKAGVGKGEPYDRFFCETVVARCTSATAFQKVKP